MKMVFEDLLYTRPPLSLEYRIFIFITIVLIALIFLLLVWFLINKTKLLNFLFEDKK